MVLEIKRYFNYIKKQFLEKDGLNFLILYVTSKCNLACQTCFFHNSLNRVDDLSFLEYQKIAQSIDKKVSILGLGGGEPFLNKDLVRICSVFIKNLKVDSLFIPTNATLTDEISKKTEILLKKFPKISISVNPSLDGLAKYHDQSRQMPGTFNKAIKTIEELSKLKKEYSHLQIVVNSVIQKDNLEELKKLMIFLRQFDLDFHAFEIMRGDHRNNSLSLPDLDQIKKIHQLILKNRYWYFKKRAGINKNFFFNWLEKMAVFGTLRYSQFFKELSLSGKSWPSSCQAGRSINVIYPNGDFPLCELSSPIINLREINYDLGKFLKSQEILKRIKEIKRKGCHCTHICFIHSTIAADIQSIFKIIYYYLKSLAILKND